MRRVEDAMKEEEKIQMKRPDSVSNIGIIDHHDGHGLNDSIEIECDARDVENGGGASHYYELWMPFGNVASNSEEMSDLVDKLEKLLQAAPNDYRLTAEGDRIEQCVARIQFQHGPRSLPSSTTGITEAALFAVLIDRLRAFQGGPFSCRENAIQLTKLEEALHWTRARADNRAKRGVLGKNEK